MIVKCFALWQPWASLVIEGLKKIETRPQFSSHRGLTGIHATKDQPAWAKDLFYTEPFFSRLKKCGFETFESLPRAGVLGTVVVTDWLKVVVRDPIHPKAEMNSPKDHVEKSFGDYTAGRYGILMKGVHKFFEPFPAIGKQSMLFDIDIPDEYLSETKS